MTSYLDSEITNGYCTDIMWDDNLTTDTVILVPEPGDICVVQEDDG